MSGGGAVWSCSSLTAAACVDRIDNRSLFSSCAGDGAALMSPTGRDNSSSKRKKSTLLERKMQQMLNILNHRAILFLNFHS